MLIRADIINQLAERAGIPQAEAAQFMEVLLFKLSELLFEGDSFSIRGIGKFAISPRKNLTRPNIVSGKILVFTPEGSSQNLTFSAPNSIYTPSSETDNIFSMNMSRKFIPVRGNPLTEDEMPQPSDNIKKLIDQRAEHILTDGTFQKSSREVEPNLNLSDETDKNETPFHFGPPELEVMKKQDTTESVWGFGDDWKKEYEEDILLDSADENGLSGDFEVHLTDEPEVPEWSFGNEANKNTDSKEKQKPETKEFDIDSFAPVKSMTRELEIDISEFDSDDTFDDDDNNYEDDIVPEDFDALFKKSLAENVMSVTPEEIEKINSKEFSISNNSLDAFTEEEADDAFSGDGAAAIDLRGDKLSTRVTPDDSFEFSGVRDTIELKSAPKSKSYLIYYILSFLLLTVAGMLVYVKLYGVPPIAEKYLNTKPVEHEFKPSTVVVERDYAFPVSYPYEKTEAILKAQPIEKGKENINASVDDAKLKAEEQKKIEADKNEKKIAEQKKIETDKKAAEEAKLKEQKKKKEEPKAKEVTKLPAGSFKDAKINNASNGFVLQVMSLPNSQKAGAEKTVSRLRASGFNAFIAEIDLPGKGLYDRVMVGPYKSRADAERDLKKIKGE